MEQTAAAVSAHLVNRQIKGFRFYNLNDSYFAFEPNALWVFDTGVQIDFTDGFFSFGWNSDYQAFDYSVEKTIPELQTSELLYAVDATETAALDRLTGTTVTDVAFAWDYYQEYDEFAQLKDEKIYFPVGLTLSFDNGEKLCLAAVTYGIHSETRQLAKVTYSLDGHLLVAFNKEIAIASPH